MILKFESKQILQKRLIGSLEGTPFLIENAELYWLFDN